MAYSNMRPKAGAWGRGKSSDTEYSAFLRIIHEPYIKEIKWEAMDLSSSLIGDWKDGRRLFLTVQLPVWKSLESIEWGIKFTDDPYDYAIDRNMKPQKSKGEVIEEKVSVYVPNTTTPLSRLLEKYKYSPEIMKPVYDKEKNILYLTVGHIPPPHVLANFMLSWYEPFNGSKIKVTHHYQLSYSMIDAFKKNYRKIEEKQ